MNASSRRRGWLGLGLVAAFGLSGCASTLSTLQTGKTLEPGHVRIAAGMGVYVPAGQVVSAVSEGVDLSKRMASAVSKNEAVPWTPEDEQKVITSAVALAVLPPSALAELSVRVGVVENLDLGVRYSTNALRLDGKFRVFHEGEAMTDSPLDPKGRGTDVALMAGASKYLFKSPVLDLLDYVKMGDFSRWDAEAAVIVSHEFSKYVGIYGAPKYVFSRTTMDATLVRVTQETGGVVKTDVAVPAQVDMHFVGATAGLRAGIPQISFFVELTFGTTFARPTLLGQARELGGATLYPAAGLAVSL